MHKRQALDGAGLRSVDSGGARGLPPPLGGRSWLTADAPCAADAARGLAEAMDAITVCGPAREELAAAAEVQREIEELTRELTEELASLQRAETSGKA